MIFKDQRTLNIPLNVIFQNFIVTVANVDRITYILRKKKYIHYKNIVSRNQSLVLRGTYFIRVGLIEN